MNAATCCSCTGSATGSCRSSRTCSTTRRSPTWRRVTSSIDRSLIARPRSCASNRFDIEPEITAKILKRGVRIYEVPISYTGREFDEGKKITWRDGFAALWTLVKYRLPTDPDAAAAALGRRRRQLRGRRTSLAACVRSVLADTSAGPVELVVVDNGSTDGSIEALRAALPGRAGSCGRPATSATRVPRTSASRRRVRRSSRCSTRTSSLEPGAAKALVEPAASASRASGACGPRLRNLDGTDYPSARTMPSLPVAVGHGAARAVVAAATRSPRGTAQLDADPDVPRLGRLGLGRRDVAAARRRSTRWAGGTSATSCTWRTPISAGGCDARAGTSRTNRRPSCTTCRARAPRSGRTACCSNTTGPRGGSRGDGSPASRRSSSRSRRCCSRRVRCWPFPRSGGEPGGGRAEQPGADPEARTVEPRTSARSRAGPGEGP